MEQNRQNVNLFLIVLIAFSQQIGLAIITPSLFQMSSALSVSMYSIMGLYMVGMGVGQVFWGTFSDIIGRKLLMVIGVFIFAITGLLITVSDSPMLILLLRFIQGFSTGAMYSISQAIIADQSNTNSKMITAIALSDLGFGFAWMILPFIGGFISLAHNWKINFYFMAAFVLAVAILTLIFLTETRGEKRINKLKVKETAKLFISMYKNPLYIVIPLLIAVPNTFFNTFNSNAPAILALSLAKSPVFVGLMSSILGLSYTIAVFFNLGFLNNKKSHKIIFSMTILFVLFSFIQLLLAGAGILNVYSLYVPMILNIVAWGIMFPHILAYGLTLYRNDGGTVGSNLGFTFFILAGGGTYFFGKIFENNFAGIADFTFILSIITVVLMIYFNLFCVVKKQKIKEAI